MSLNYSTGEIDDKILWFSISVLIPLTGFKTIDDTIESVIRQGCSECEILILRNDIQSLPQGTDVAEKNVSYLDSDYLLREIFIREKGKGNALNEGILRAKNNLVCVLDADCILKENALSQAVRHFENEAVV
ncbi:MAG: glycosyltransferase family 2 protein, partial [Clostridia bacterium]|nr:glycosyltransferase family 2 protein [Clostridia bacterium]